MPRGQWDRTKTKEQRAAEKAAGKAPTKSPKAKGKRGGKKFAGVTTEKIAAIGQGGGQMKQENTSYQFGELQRYLGSLASASAALGDEQPTMLHNEIVASIERLSEMRQAMFGRTAAEKAAELPPQNTTEAPEPEQTAPAQPTPTPSPQQVRPQQPFPPVSA